MDCCSKLAYFKKPKAGKKIVQPNINKFEDSDDEPDTNILSLRFNSLQKGENNLFMGDPQHCAKCKSVLSSLSKVYNSDEYHALNEKEENKPQAKKEPLNDNKEEEKKSDEVIKQKIEPMTDLSETVKMVASSDFVWICEFCGFHNVLNIDREEIPTENDVFYLVESADQIIKKNKIDAKQTDESIVFCLDNSGSMCVTSEIKSKKLQLRYQNNQEEMEMLKQFIEYGADQYFSNQQKNSTWISRKQCMIAAIENQLEEMSKIHPDRKAGLVVFNDDVLIVGDGLSNPITITGDKLNKHDICLNQGIEAYQSHMAKPIADSSKQIIDKLSAIQEKGPTALGPALLASIGLASKGKAGSKVILCTDGLANIGLGRMDDEESESQAQKFYEEVGNYAKEKGIMINVITIKGEGCKIDKLAKLADFTGGSVTRVNPEKILDNFANIIKDELAATGVDIKVRLHDSVKFRGEDSQNLSEQQSLLTKSVGNVTNNTELTFEYARKTDEELSQLGLDIERIKEIPFQAQFTYTSLNGDRIKRVVTMKLKITDDSQQANKDANIKLLAARASQLTSLEAEQGNYIKAKKLNKKWDKLLQVNKEVNRDNADHQKVFSNYSSKNNSLMKAVNKGVQRKVRKNSITLLNEINELEENDQKELNCELDNLSDAGSDDEGYADFHKFKRMDSCDYARSPVRSRSASPEEKISSPKQSKNSTTTNRKPFMEKLKGLFGSK